LEFFGRNSCGKPLAKQAFVSRVELNKRLIAKPMTTTPPITTDDARTRLLETAGEIFAEKGFTAATVREICSAAGANVAAVNYYFGDKQRLYIEALKHAHGCRFNAPPPQWPEGTPPEVKLREFVFQMLTHLLDKSGPPWSIKLIMREMIEPSEACRALTEEKIRPIAMVMMSIVRELLPADTPLPKLQMTAFSIIGQCLFYRTQEHIARHLIGAEAFDAFTIPQLTDHIVGLSLAALGRPWPLPPKEDAR
jgi:AcrR family transcriptional regulator